jgi:hypothetical protein
MSIGLDYTSSCWLYASEEIHEKYQECLEFTTCNRKPWPILFQVFNMAKDLRAKGLPSSGLKFKKYLLET